MSNVRRFTLLIFTVTTLIVLAPLAMSEDSLGGPGRNDRGKNPLRNVYFGEQHLHTQASPDSFAIGNRGTWEDAYRWAMGEEITLSTTGKKIQKSTPYDFVGITDHAEYFGIMPRLIDPKDSLYDTEFGRELRDPNATYTNDIGDSQLSAVWTDPTFDPHQRAAYYVRVVEIPTPRWSTYDAVRNNLPLVESLPATIQERAWSSPIWYTPTREELIEQRLKEITGEKWGIFSLSE